MNELEPKICHLYLDGFVSPYEIKRLIEEEFSLDVIDMDSDIESDLLSLNPDMDKNIAHFPEPDINVYIDVAMTVIDSDNRKVCEISYYHVNFVFNENGSPLVEGRYADHAGGHDASRLTTELSIEMIQREGKRDDIPMRICEKFGGWLTIPGVDVGMTYEKRIEKIGEL